jgi:deazaflavin-dependent oxidoreductase (nitroreductase family)
LKKTSPSSSSKNSNIDQEKYLYLTTRGRKTGQPRQIEIWFTHHGGRFYLIAEYATSKWVQNIRAEPQVKVRVAGEEFSGLARILPEDEPELTAAVQDLSRQKYGWGEGLVVEITRETPPPQ